MNKEQQLSSVPLRWECVSDDAERRIDDLLWASKYIVDELRWIIDQTLLQGLLQMFGVYEEVKDANIAMEIILPVDKSAVYYEKISETWKE